MRQPEMEEHTVKEQANSTPDHSVSILLDHQYLGSSSERPSVKNVTISEKPSVKNITISEKPSVKNITISEKPSVKNGIIKGRPSQHKRVIISKPPSQKIYSFSKTPSQKSENIRETPLQKCVSIGKSVGSGETTLQRIVSSSETLLQKSVCLSQTPTQKSVDISETDSPKSGCSNSVSCREQGTSELTATSIQQCFQNMLNMTALSDLDSRPKQQNACTSNLDECKVVRLELRLVNNPIDQNIMSNASASTLNDVVNKKLTDITSKKEENAETSDLSTLQTEDDKIRKEWKKINRNFQEDIYSNTLLQYTMSLLLKRWTEYLEFTPEEMCKFELDNARDSNLTEDVIDILQDRDLHVWQILDKIGN